jgi:aminoglycoside phosphotransferase (APT) family kinase protein
LKPPCHDHAVVMLLGDASLDHLKLSNEGREIAVIGRAAVWRSAPIPSRQAMADL